MASKPTCEECHRKVKHVQRISYYDPSVDAEIMINVCDDCKAKRIADGGLEVTEESV